MGDIVSSGPIPNTSVRQQISKRLSALTFQIITAAIFTAAVLLFWVQPMFGKLVLPLLGGTPAVWTATLLFFQTALLAGYLYAHVLAKFLPVRLQIIVHISILTLTVLSLPVGVSDAVTPPADAVPALWVFGLLTSSIGLPYVAIAATSPLLQRWFSLSSHAAASNPYQLYAASNAGSLIGLLGYPLLIEPLAGAAAQTILWSGGYLLFVILIAASGLSLRIPESLAQQKSKSETPTTTFERFRWTALAFVPSSLLLAVTTHITTDIAAMPLLWAVPLALYLLTFIVAFAPTPLLPRNLLRKCETLSIVILATMLWFDGSNAAGLAISLIAFFVIALSRHCDLVSVKPGSGHLTEFYMWMAVGGALGGLFNALLAPILFERITEFPLTLLAAAFTRILLPTHSTQQQFRWFELAAPVAALAVLIVLHFANVSVGEIPLPAVVAFLALAAFALYHFQSHEWRFALGLMALLIIVHGKQDAFTRYEARSFFGAYRVYEQPATGHIILSHGTTIHGAQRIDEHRPAPLTYYAAEGPLGQAVSALSETQPSLRYGVIGMGAGASACHSRDSDIWTFFEIDPLVISIAKEQGAFSFLKDCTPKARIVVGDARLSMKKEANGAFDILVMDAFSSDSIPTHLMTREALSLARTKLAPGGVILFNISNRYLRLEPVVANTARAAGLSGISQIFRVNEAQSKRLMTSSHWIALSADAAALSRIASTGNWKPLRPDVHTTVWTDDYSSLLGVLNLQ